MRAPRRHQSDRSGNMVLAIVVILGVAFAAVFALVTLVPYGSQEQTYTVTEIAPPEADYVQRGLRPNSTVPAQPTPGPVTDNPVQPAGASTEEPGGASPVAPDSVRTSSTTTAGEGIGYVTSTDWNRYHLPTCKYAQHLEPDKRRVFATATEARQAGYVPCKVCKPPATDPGAAEAQGPAASVEPVQSVPPTAEPSPPKPVRSGPLGFKATPVDFLYWVASREVDTYQDVVRVDYEVDVETALTRDQALSLAKYLIAEDVKKQGVNSVSFIIRRKARQPDDAKWLIWIDWAPYGSVARAGVSATGDYGHHQFSIVLEGVHSK